MKSNQPVFIEDPTKRKVMITKRKKVLLKKALELKMLTEVDIFMCVFDKNKQKLDLLITDSDFD